MPGTPRNAEGGGQELTPMLTSWVRTEISQTMNVPREPTRGLFIHNIVTKYVIRVALRSASRSRPQIEWQVARRYSHFRANHAALHSMFSPQIRLPRLPPKELNLRSGPPDPNRVAERMLGLDIYLRALMGIERVARRR